MFEACVPNWAWNILESSGKGNVGQEKSKVKFVQVSLFVGSKFLLLFSSLSFQKTDAPTCGHLMCWNTIPPKNKYWNLCWNALDEIFWPDSLKQRKTDDKGNMVPDQQRTNQFSTEDVLCERFGFFYSQTYTFIVSQFVTKASMHRNLWGPALDLRNPKVFRVRTMMRRLGEWYFYS